MMKAYEHTRQFQAKFCEVDFKDELKTSIVLSYLEEVACSSAQELGFGYEYIKSRGFAFMVSNICCEFLSPIKLGEVFTVKTWPTPPTYVIFGREYQMFSQNGDLCVNASSRWCLIDYKTGKIMQSKVLDNQDYSTYNNAQVLENVQWKIPSFSPSEGELRFSLTVANSEYDHNLHVNNTRYADYCFNCFSVAELNEISLKRFTISYLKQCKEGEKLSFYRKQTNHNTYLVAGFNGLGETVVQACIEIG